MCSVTDEAQKNQDVVTKIDMVQKEMRQQRENLLSQPEEADKMEQPQKPVVLDKELIFDELEQEETFGEKETVPEAGADQEIKEPEQKDDNLSLDLADLEDLENDTFGDFKPKEKQDSARDHHETPEK